MVIIHMEVVRKMSKMKKIFFFITVFSFFIFTHIVFAVNYGSGSYGSSLYSATTPGAIANPAEGTYNNTQQITLSTEAGNTIRYLFTATPGSCSSGNLYNNPIEVSEDTKIYTLTCDIYGNSTPNLFSYFIVKPKSIFSGSTVQGRINNLINMGQNDKAQELAREFNLEKDNSIIKLTRTLKKGMVHSEVKLLQMFLNKNGYTISVLGWGSVGRETNYFGDKTKKALMLFQKDNNLKPDGIAGPLTIKIINAFKVY